MIRKFVIGLAALMVASLACTPTTVTPTETPTKAPAIPTSAPTPAAAATSTRAAVPKPALPPGVLFTDDFSSQQASEDKGWSFDPSDNVDWTWSSGRLTALVKKSQTIGWNRPDGTFDNFGADLEAQALSNGYVEYGIIFRVSGTTDSRSYYTFGVNTDGKYFLQKKVDGKWADPDPVKAVASQYVKQGKTKNTLAVLADGSKISLYVNGFGVKTINDASIASGGLGVFVATGDNDSAEAGFSRITILTTDKARAEWGAPPDVSGGGGGGGGGSGNGVFYVRNTFSGPCQVSVWGKTEATIRAEPNSTASKSLPPGTYGAKVALANGREADIPNQLQLPPGGQCTVVCYEKSYNYGCGQ